MRLGALVLGCLGAGFGFLGGLFVILVGGVGSIFAAEGAGTVAGLGLIALGASTVGLVGAVLAVGRPLLGAALMAAAAVIGIIVVSLAYILGGALLALAAVLAFRGRHTPPSIRVYRIQ